MWEQRAFNIIVVAAVVVGAIIVQRSDPNPSPSNTTNTCSGTGGGGGDGTVPACTASHHHVELLSTANSTYDLPCATIVIGGCGSRPCGRCCCCFVLVAVAIADSMVRHGGLSHSENRSSMGIALRTTQEEAPRAPQGRSRRQAASPPAKLSESPLPPLKLVVPLNSPSC